MNKGTKALKKVLKAVEAMTPEEYIKEYNNIPERKGKAFANKKKLEDQPLGNLYDTPKSLVWVAKDIIEKEFTKYDNILEPAVGNRSLSQEILRQGYKVEESDLFPKSNNILKKDYLKYPSNDYFGQQLITNPPFNLWDEFVLKAKGHCEKFMMIGRANYRGSQGRLISGEKCFKCPEYKGNYFCNKYKTVITKAKCKDKLDENSKMKDSVIWKNLKGIYEFSRYVDYQTPYRKDGLFNVGSMLTAWYLWDMAYEGEPTLDVLDVNKYAKLGQFKKNIDGEPMK